MISNARMYSVTPAAAAAWQQIFNWVQARAEVNFEAVAHAPPLLLSDLWERDDLGMVMMCGLPLARRARPVQILGAPLPSLPGYEGKPHYRACIAVRADSPARTLADTFGGVAGYTLRDSHSGYYAFRHHLLRHHGTDAQYAKTVGGFLNAHEIILALVEGKIDVGPLDGYVYDLMCATWPEFAAQVRVIDRTMPAPIPPLTCSSDLPGQQVARLRAALQDVETEPALTEARRTLCLTRFVAVDAGAYHVQRDIAARVDESPISW